MTHHFRNLNPAGTRNNPETVVNSALSENGGHSGGQFGSDSESVASLRQQALMLLQLAARDTRRMESLSDDSAESRAAGRALVFVDRAFRELEGGKRGVCQDPH